jgi:hypothetical protein
MGHGASSAAKQRTAPAFDQKRQQHASSSHETPSLVQPEQYDRLPLPGVAMRAAWGSCVLSGHVAALVSKLNFNVASSAELGCLHSIAARAASDEHLDPLHASTSETAFSSAERELGLLAGDALQEQQALFKDAAEKLEDFHEFAETFARIFCNDHIRSTFLRKKSHVLVSCMIALHVNDHL